MGGCKIKKGKCLPVKNFNYCYNYKYKNNYGHVRGEDAPDEKCKGKDISPPMQKYDLAGAMATAAKDRQ